MFVKRFCGKARVYRFPGFPGLFVQHKVDLHLFTYLKTCAKKNIEKPHEHRAVNNRRTDNVSVLRAFETEISLYSKNCSRGVSVGYVGLTSFQHTHA